MKDCYGIEESIYAGAAVVGSGVAGLAAALRLSELGVKDCVLVTESFSAGTSVNAGSDKQTYYKLSVGGSGADSVRRMAQDIFSGGCVDGDNALCEAALSAREFFRLVNLGVDFPCTGYGEYVGYKTDHDEAGRASGTGPFTSADICEKLRREVLKSGVRVIEGASVVFVFTGLDGVRGLLLLNPGGENTSYTLIKTPNVILATGGPSGMFADSVYPESQTGASGMAFEAGADGQNLTEWQYGPASVEPRWNVSGSYMQVIPALISALPDGSDEREIIIDPDMTPAEAHSAVFFKGYQWPFDSAKISGRYRSSLVDLAIVRESEAGRQVFLDFTRNPAGLDFDSLDPEAKAFIKSNGIDFELPFERLIRLNRPAYEFYLSRGVDLSKTPLRIAECVQHSNGGLAVDSDWQTRVKGLYAAGEISGTHGVRRPGGSALNECMVGASRAAEHIARCGRTACGEIPDEELYGTTQLPFSLRGKRPARDILDKARKVMTRAAGISRDAETLESALETIRGYLVSLFSDAAPARNAGEARTIFMLRDTLISQTVYLSAMLDYARDPGISRGSSIYGGRPAPVNTAEADIVRETYYIPEMYECATLKRPVRPIPPEPGTFEDEWKQFRERKAEAPAAK